MGFPQEKMLYCFISELLKLVDHTHPYWIQHQYAIRINKYIEYSFEKDGFYDKQGNKMRPPSDRVLWIGDCIFATAMDGVTERYGLDSVDSEQTRKSIESWYMLGVTKREIKGTDINGALDYAGSHPLFFLKTASKGSSTVVQDGFIDDLFWKSGDCLVVSEYQEIVEDDMGKKEVRCMVLDGEVLNCSRYVHSIRHTISDTWYREAEIIKNKIIGNTGFPRSFTMDLAMFRDNDGNSYYDLVEVNSLSTALCYINNSLFTDIVPEIKEVYNETCWGYEYCFDYLKGENSYYYDVKDPREFVYER